MIKTKSVYDDKEDSDGIRILVARYCLSGIRRKNFDTWYSELSPSKSLLKNFKDGKMSQNIFFQFFYSNYYRYYMSGLVTRMGFHTDHKLGIRMVLYQ
ncbi:MAG: hypothetical protein QOC23_08140 [Nitrososphaeraceae archaeon]|nr:hypothetical protein [Nitrososphaeraceae archaeon]